MVPTVEGGGVQAQVGLAPCPDSQAAEREEGELTGQPMGWETVAEEVVGVVVLQVKKDDTMAPALDIGDLQAEGSESMMSELRLSKLGTPGFPVKRQRFGLWEVCLESRR